MFPSLLSLCSPSEPSPGVARPDWAVMNWRIRRRLEERCGGATADWLGADGWPFKKRQSKWRRRPSSFLTPNVRHRAAA